MLSHTPRLKPKSDKVITPRRNECPAAIFFKPSERWKLQRKARRVICGFFTPHLQWQFALYFRLANLANQHGMNLSCPKIISLTRCDEFTSTNYCLYQQEKYVGNSLRFIWKQKSHSIEFTYIRKSSHGCDYLNWAAGVVNQPQSWGNVTQLVRFWK